MGYKNLTPDQMERAKACKTPEELAVLARAEGFELSDRELEGLGGGTAEPDSCADLANIFKGVKGSCRLG